MTEPLTQQETADANQDSTAAKMAAKWKAERIQNWKDASADFDSAAMVFQMLGKQKEAEGAKKLSEFSDRVSRIMEMSGTASTAMMVNVYLGAAMIAVSLLQESQKPSSPYPAIFEMLSQIIIQLENLRTTLFYRLNELDDHVSALLAQQLPISDATLHNTDEIERMLVDLQKTMTRFHQEVSNQILGLRGHHPSGREPPLFSVHRQRRSASVDSGTLHQLPGHVF